MSNEHRINFIHVNHRQYGELDDIIAFLRASGVKGTVIKQVSKLRDVAMARPSEFVRPNSCPECGNPLQFK